MKRMEDRGFNEVDLRRMLEHAGSHRPDIVEGRFVIEARHAGQSWEVIVEPDDTPQLLVVIYGVSCGAGEVMKEPYLEVTFRHGRAIAAYYYLPRQVDQKSVRTRRVEPGLVIDFSTEGQAIGIEITTPTKLSLAALNAVLRELGHPPASQADLAPVLAA